MSEHLSFKAITSWLPDSDEDWNQMLLAIQVSSDREAAILAAAFLEETLKLALACSFAENTHKEMFEGSDAPLSTFAAKIRLSEALAIVGPVGRKKMDAIRKVRNAFAHSLLPFDFTEPSIVQLTDCLDDGDASKIQLNFTIDFSTFSLSRRRYCYECLALGRNFVDYSFKVGGTIRTTFID